MKLFAKDGQSSITSLPQFLFYSFLLLLSILLFLKFNSIPTTNIIIEADKLKQSRGIYEIGRESDFSKGIYLQYQFADLEIMLPKSYSYNHKNNILKVESRSDVLFLADSIQDKSIYISPYWACVYSNAVSYCNYRINFEDSLYNLKKYEDILAYYEYANYSFQGCILAPELLDEDYLNTTIKMPEIENTIDSLLPNSVSIDWTYPFRFKISSNFKNVDEQDIGENITNSNWKSILNDSTIFEQNMKRDVWDFESENYKFYILESYKEGIENIENRKYLSTEVLASTFYTKDSILVKPNRFDDFYDYHTLIDTIPFSIPKGRELLGSIPNLLDRYDISQGWYNFELHSSTIDSIILEINFIGATEFYPMEIEPDEIGSNYIKYTNQEKIMKIRLEGLSFYAIFKEMENIQNIRSLAVTAIISGLIIIVLTMIFQFITHCFKKMYKVFSDMIMHLFE